MTQPPRTAIARARRLVVKVGSSSLTRDGHGLDLDSLHALVDVLAAAAGAGRQVVLVSSGAIAAGGPVLGLSRRPKDLATQQAAAAVGQGLLMAAYEDSFRGHGLTAAQVLLTSDDVTRRGHYVNARRTLDRLLELGVVPVVNENDTVATSEIRFGDNDRLAGLVAHLIHADALVLLSDVDALYDGPPSRPGARRVALVAGPDALDGVRMGGSGSSAGTGGMVTKVQAAAAAAADGIPTVVTATPYVGEALTGQDVGTLFLPTGPRRASRAVWLAHASQPLGAVRVDAGAVTALRERGRSLLAIGVTGIDGTFAAGDPVDVAGPDGTVVARGLASYAAGELERMAGRSTEDLRTELGADFTRPVIHRDDLVILRLPRPAETLRQGRELSAAQDRQT